MQNVVRLASEIQFDSIVDGEGIRTVIWFQGCPHNCFDCHNPQSHDFNGGFEILLEDVLAQTEKLENQSGVTFSGGEPMMQPDTLLLIAKKVKEQGMNVWCWSGFTFEELLKMSEKKHIYLELLAYIDVLVDGKFEYDKKSLNAKFRGSTNQRILDVPESLEKKKAIVIEKYQ